MGKSEWSAAVHWPSVSIQRPAHHKKMKKKKKIFNEGGEMPLLQPAVLKHLALSKPTQLSGGSNLPDITPRPHLLHPLSISLLRNPSDRTLDPGIIVSNSVKQGEDIKLSLTTLDRLVFA